MADDTFTALQVLDELDYLATVEHALCVHYLFIGCVLSVEAGLAGRSIESSERLSGIADAAHNIAIGEMFHIRPVNEALLLAGRPPNLGRASHILPASGPAISLVSVTADGLTARENAIAATVDRRRARLRAAVATPGLFDGDLLARISSVLDSSSDHTDQAETLAEQLSGLDPFHHRAGPADEVERTLLALSDRYYQAIVDTLRGAIAHDEAVGGQLRGFAIPTMTSLDEINRQLAARGLVPSFTLPS